MGSTCAYLSIRVNGKSTLALVDTGSELSLAPRALVRSTNIHPSSQVLHAANGSVIHVIGETMLNCQMGDYRFRVPCLVTEQVSEVIFGLTWLENQQAQWNFSKRRIEIRGRSFPLVSQPNRGKCRKVMVARDVQVPPLSEMDIDAYAVIPNLRTECTSWATTPRVLESGLVVAGTLLPEQGMEFMVRVLNPTAEQIRLRRGQQCPTEEVVVNELMSGNSAGTQCAVIQSMKSMITPSDNTSVLTPLWENVAEDVPSEGKEQLKSLILERRQAFSLNESDLGHTDLLEHEIDTGTEAPVRQPLRRQPLTLLPVIDEQVSQMLDQGLIEPANSAWSSNVVLVKKKDGSPRFCIDYRALNAKTRKDAYPLPLISESLDALAGSRWFSTFDLRAGYHQMSVHPKDRHKTAFVTRRGSYQFRVLPFGLCNSPATFARMMNLAMTGLNYDICLIYLDDIIVFANDLPTHLERLRQLLDRLLKVGLKLKPSKCNLLQKSVLFLGHVVSEQGVATDPSKIEAVVNWPRPRNLRDVRAFIGLCTYYRKFVEGFASLARPLHDLTKKRAKFEWTESCQQAFETLKQKLTTSPVLALPIDGETYILDTDASGTSIGAVLSQIQNGHERVICYGSRTCSDAERNYDVTRREMLAIVHYLKAFRQYLLGVPFVLRTDHAALQWLRRTPRPIGQQARWLTIVEEFRFEIQHRAGSRHQNADAMSRRPQEVDAIRQGNSPRTDDSDLPDGWSLSSMKREQEEDDELGWILVKKRNSSAAPTADELRPMSEEVKFLAVQWPQLSLKDGVLVRCWVDAKDGRTSWTQLVPPVGRRKQLIRLAHVGMTGGHLGVRRTSKNLQRRAYWPGWRGQVRTFLRQCSACSRYLRGVPPHQGRLQRMEVGNPWERVGVDITGPHPESTGGHKYIVTLVDHFTRWAEAFPIRRQDAVTVAQVLVTNVFTRFGCPQEILTDQGACFEAELFQEVCKLLQIHKIRTSAYKPSTNGMVERFHRTLNALLAKAVSHHQRDWHLHLPFVLCAYRSREHEGTGYSPCKLFLGREMWQPMDLVLGDLLGGQTTPQSVPAFVDNLEQKMRDAYNHVREYTGQLASRRASRYNLKVTEREFAPGSWVLYHYPRKRVGRKDKWEAFYTGPYQVLEKLSPVLYRIQRSPRSLPKVVYVDKLKPFEGIPPEEEEEATSRPVTPILVEGPEIEVEGRGSDGPIRPARPQRQADRKSVV